MLKLIPPRAGASPYWRVRGSYLGVTVDRSTKATGRTIAGKILKEIEREIECGRFAKPAGPTFGEAVVRYLRDGRDPRFINRLLDRFENTPLETINQHVIEDAAFELYPNATPATRNRQVFTPMSAILQHAGVDIRLRRPAGANGAKREFTFRQEQAEALISAAMGMEPEFGVFLVFLLYTGCRLSEGLSLQVEDVDLAHSTALVRDTKNGLDRRVHLPPVLVAALASHPQGLHRVGRVFRYHKGQRLSDRLHKAAEAAGVHIPDGIAFHAFRHTWASWMRRYAGLDTTGLVATGAWLSPDAARRYEHAVASEEAQRADLLPEIRVKAV